MSDDTHTHDDDEQHGEPESTEHDHSDRVSGTHATVVELDAARRKREPWRAKVPPMPELTGVETFKYKGANDAELTEPLLQNLYESALTDDEINAARLFCIRDTTTPTPGGGRGTQRYYLGKPPTRPATPPVILFPFFLPGESQPFGYRMKFERPRMGPKKRAKDGTVKRKAIKYEQPSETGVWVYYPPLDGHAARLRNHVIPLVWTEGEKKALLLAALGYAVVGLTGVWNWVDSTEKKDTQAERLHPDIRGHCLLAGRSHVIVFDSDARENDDVMLAAQKLAGQLIAAGASSVVLCLPPCTDKGEKQGIDDYAFNVSRDAARALVDASHEPIDAIEPSLGALPARRFKALTGSGIEAWEARLPPEYELDKHGAIWQRPSGAADKLVCESPIVITRVLSDLYSNETRLDLHYRVGSQWREVIVPREVAGDRALSPYIRRFGADITASTVQGVVEWLAAFERTNVKTMPHVRCVSRAGWHRVDGAYQFVTSRAVTPEVTPKPTPLQLDANGGERAIFAALAPVPNANLAQHIEALRVAWNASDDAALAICAAFAAPLLMPLSMANFAIHFCGDSSRGKTSMLRCSASVYGEAGPGSPIIASWLSTGAGLEQRAAALTDLPQFYDEAGAGDPELITRSMYMLCNGQGKARSTKDMRARDVATWRTIVVSSGEHELVEASAATGAQVRVVSVPITGFGELDARGIESVVAACLAHAGAAGEKWLQYLVEFDADDWAQSRAELGQFRTACTKIAERTGEGSSGLSSRIGAYFALLGFAEYLAHECFGLGSPLGETMRRVYERRCGIVDDRVRPSELRAAEYLIDAIRSEPNAFPILKVEDATGEQSSPRSGGPTRLYGYRGPEWTRVPHGTGLETGEIALIPNALRELLKRGGFAERQVLRGWQARGWLRADAARGRLTRRLTIDGQRSSMVVVRLPTLSTDESESEI